MSSEKDVAPVGDDLVAEGARLLADGDLEAALEALQRAGARDPESLRLRLVTGIAAWRLSNLEQALAVLRQCHEEDPQNGTIAEVLAALVAQAGDLVESLYFGKIATALGPKPGFVELVPAFFPSFGAAFLSVQERPLFARAKMMAKSGKLLAAIDFASQHVSLNADDDEARNFLADHLRLLGVSAVAREVLRPAVDRGGAPPALVSRYAGVCAAVGEAAEARERHQAACAQAPEDAAIAAAAVADSIWLDGGSDAGAARAAEWAKRFCPSRKPAALHRGADKLAVGYLVSSLVDPLDAAAVAAVARAHDRSRFTVVGYGRGAQSWLENGMLSGAFDKWCDVSDLDPATLARVLRGDGISAVIDCAGFAAPTQLMALARVNTAIRIAWLGVPPGLGAPFYDAVLGRGGGTTPAWGAEKNYPLVRDWIKPMVRNPADAVRFGSNVSLCQIDEPTARLWSTILKGVPGSTLALRARDMGRGGNIDRLVARFGREIAARIDIVDTAAAEEFYPDVDIALAPVRGTSPRMAAEAIACGSPVVALAGASLYEPYGAFLRGLGLGDRLVGADEQDYISIALGLAGSAVARAQVTAAVATIAAAGEASARGIAEIIESNAARMLSEVVGP